MNRLRILKQRAARGMAGTAQLREGWFAHHGRGWGDCFGPMSRREAIQLAARLGMPSKRVEIKVTYGEEQEPVAQ